jgi:Uma2 family endonuclease
MSMMSRTMERSADKAAPASQSQNGRPTWTPPPDGAWTYDDYARLPDNGFRYEVIDGALVMSPAPLVRHQKTFRQLFTHLVRHCERHRLGEVLSAPIDVMLGDRATPVQPDIVFVSQDRLPIVGRERIEGAPDLVVEILSRSTAARDRGVKFDIYAAAGVREYWLVDPEERTLEVFVLRGQAYAPLGTYRPGDVAASELLAGLKLKVKELFQN